MATNAEIFARDQYRCVRCGERANTVQHRRHGNRADRRPSNLLSACMGPSSKDCHTWMEHNRRAARSYGWETTRHGRAEITLASPAWYEAGPFGQGWYLLDDEGWLEKMPDGGRTLPA